MAARPPPRPPRPRRAPRSCSPASGRDADLREVTLGERWRLRGHDARARCSWITPPPRPPSPANWRRTAQKRGFDFIDAPVSGGEAGRGQRQAHHHVRRQRRRPMPRAEPVMAAYATPVPAAGPGGLRPAHQDGQPDLHRRHRAGPGRRLQLRARRRPRYRGGGGGDLQGRGAKLADGEPPQDHGCGRI